jgi:DNA mismatch repair ATPase MutS
MDAIADLDLTVEKARLARRWGGVMPQLTEDRLCMQRMVSPRMVELLRDHGLAFTPISMETERGVTVITGANMGGKSVALKTLALNVYLVQHGFFPFAESAQVPLFDGIHILSEDLENVDRGLSSFGGEIVGFNQIITQLKSGLHFVMLDEFARGTNPEEGAAIVQAVTQYLSRRPAMTVLATHFDAVAPLAQAHYQVVGLRQLDMARLQRELAGLQGTDSVHHISRYMNYGLYRVQDSRDCPRDALNICRLLGMDGEILDLAEKTTANHRKLLTFFWQSCIISGSGRASAPVKKYIFRQ